MNKKRLVEIMEISLGIFLVSTGFYFFLLPTDVVIGGVMGISVLIKDFISPSLFIYIANILIMFLCLIFLGKTAFLKTIYATLLSPTIIFAFEKTIRADILISKLNEIPILIGALVGGAIIGLGLGLVLRNGTTTGGMDTIQQIIHKYLKLPFTTVMYIIDGLIITIALFINLEIGIYGLASIFIMGLVIERVTLRGANGYTVFIVTDLKDKFREEIIKMDRSFTKITAYGGFLNDEHDMLICTIQSRELYSFKQLILKTDPNAFTFVTKTKEALGKGFSKEKIYLES